MKSAKSAVYDASSTRNRTVFLSTPPCTSGSSFQLPAIARTVYDPPAGGTHVDFLVRTDGEGVLHVHLDACYSCFQYRRGYVVEEDDLVCVACRLEYPIADEIWDFIGACAPIPIYAVVEADAVVIERRLLVKAARYF